MRVLFCGGGTAGHISPSLAVAEALLSENTKNTAIFVGRLGGGENLPIEKAGYPLYTLDVAPIPRRVSAESLKRAVRLLKSFGEAKEILKKTSPDAVLATGGYVSYPILRAASRMHIPTLIHESNAIPGSATRLLSGGCQRILLGFEEAKGCFRGGERIRTVGNPVRSEFYHTSREESRKRLGIPRSASLVLSFGGSLGAEFFNRLMPEVMHKCEEGCRTLYFIHATGAQYYGEMKEKYPMLSAKGRCRIVPYIEDMPTYLSAADAVICRAGSSTIAELCAVGVASILIPSPNVAKDHQTHNAEAVYERGGCIVLAERDADAVHLVERIRQLTEDRALNRRMSEKMRALSDRRAAEKIISEIRACINSSSASY